MLKDVNCNMLEQTTQLSKSMARFDTYMQDARGAGCDQCVALWEDLRERHETELADLMQHLKAHIDAGKVDFGPK
ncbi:MAG: hypothetical protein JW767_03160 [Thermoleophilia bacterium]|nr:hypothetical protein [Thermoleophilia bacterium]